MSFALLHLENDMMKVMKIALGSVTLAAMSIGTMGMAPGGYDPYYTGHKYDYFADAAKTQYLGTVYDQGCVDAGSFNPANVNRVNIPSPYFTQEAIFYCGNGQIEPIFTY